MSRTPRLAAILMALGAAATLSACDRSPLDLVSPDDRSFTAEPTDPGDGDPRKEAPDPGELIALPAADMEAAGLRAPSAAGKGGGKGGSGGSSATVTEIDLVRYEDTADLHGHTYCGGTDVFIGPWAHGTNLVTGHAGIDTFVETILHEHVHMLKCLQWWGPELFEYDPAADQDGDYVPDSLEISFGATQGWTPDESLVKVDAETGPYIAERAWTEGTLSSVDWAYPGSQTEGGTSNP